MNGGAQLAGWIASCRLYIEHLLSSCRLVRKNANSMYRSRQSCHRCRLKFGRPAWYEIREARELHCREAPTAYLRWIFCSRTVWRINCTFNNYSKHNYDIVGDVVVQGVTPITFGTPTARPSLWCAATCHVRTILSGPECVRSWQVPLLGVSFRRLLRPFGRWQHWYTAHPYRFFYRKINILFYNRMTTCTYWVNIYVRRRTNSS